MPDLPRRKSQRLKGYDYSQNGAYFITICTRDRLPLFGEIIDNAVVLNSAGYMVEERLLNISNDVVSIEEYCIMPNHVHAIVFISRGDAEKSTLLTVSEIVRRFKTITTKLYIDGVNRGEYKPFDKAIWQKSFHDRVIRNDYAYCEILKYLDENPLRWDE